MMKKEEGIKIGKKFKKALESSGLPVQRVLLYGSVARDEATTDSDLDIAVICLPFKSTRHEENLILRHIRWNIDVRISPYCLHSDDFKNKYFGLAQEIKTTGVEI